MRLTEHFTVEEMQTSNTAARLGLPNVCPPELIPNMLTVATALEAIREQFGKPIRVLSCYRSPAVNAAVGGSPHSAHKSAHAADIQIDGVPLIDVARWCAVNLTDFDQIILEFDQWIHLGFTNSKNREQVLTAHKEGTRTVYRQGLFA